MEHGRGKSKPELLRNAWKGWPISEFGTIRSLFVAFWLKVMNGLCKDLKAASLWKLNALSTALLKSERAGTKHEGQLCSLRDCDLILKDAGKLPPFFFHFAREKGRSQRTKIRH